MELDPLLSNLLSEIDPKIKGYQDTNGKTFVKLNKALSGCVQSNKLVRETLECNPRRRICRQRPRFVRVQQNG